MDAIFCYATFGRLCLLSRQSAGPWSLCSNCVLASDSECYTSRNMKARLTFVFVILIMLLAVACSKPAPILVHIIPPHDWLGQGPPALSAIRFYANGRLMENVQIVRPQKAPRPGESEKRYVWSFVMPGVPSGQPRPEITADMIFPCGPRQLSLDPYGSSDSTVYTDERAHPEATGREERRIKGFDYEPLKSAETVELWVDNSSDQPGELTLGQMKFFVPAKQTAHLLGYFESCAGGAEVKMNGVSMGTLDREKLKATHEVVIDPAASHIYTLEAHDYSSWSAGSRPPAPASFCGSHMYFLSHYVAEDFMLRQAPLAIHTVGEQGGRREYGLTSAGYCHW